MAGELAVSEERAAEAAARVEALSEEVRG